MTLKHLVKPLVIRASQLAGLRQSEAALTRAAGRYWSAGTDGRFRGNSHWRGEGGLGSEAWERIGDRHVNLYRRFAAFAGVEPTPRHVVEWGCGGGANAIPFARLAEQFVGVDVAASSLAECRSQLEAEGLAERFTSVEAAVDDPEAAAREVLGSAGPCDLFLCVYVFELVPGPAYVTRLLRIARDLLAPGGAALVQFKYATADWRSRPRRWAYRLNLANMTVLHVEQFWRMAEEAGLTPQAMTLVPQDRLVGDERYAYALLTKPSASE